MRLAEISYELDEYEMEGWLLSGRLEIEICNVDGLPYIWAMYVDRISPDTGEAITTNFQTGKSRGTDAEVMRNKLHADRWLMDDIYDACLVEAGYQKDFAS
jgi:hypothetical protein